MGPRRLDRRTSQRPLIPPDRGVDGRGRVPRRGTRPRPDRTSPPAEAGGLDELLARFRRGLTEKGLKYTRPREVILGVLAGIEGHVSAEELFDAVRKVEPSIGFATVHRTLRLLADSGFVHEHSFGERHRRYELADRREHHDHLICTRCRRIVEFEEPRIEALQDEVAARHGFRITDHRLDLFGICVTCMAAESRPRRRDR